MTDGNKPANTEAKTNDVINDLVGGSEQMKLAMAKLHVEMEENMDKMEEQMKENMAKMQEQMKENIAKMENQMKEIMTKMHVNMKENMAKMEGQMKSSQQLFDENVAMKKQLKFEQTLMLLENNDQFKMQPIRKTIRLAISRTFFTKEYFDLNSESLEVLQFEWNLMVTVDRDDLGMALSAKPPKHYIGYYRIVADVTFSILNTLEGKNMVQETKTCYFYRDIYGNGGTFIEWVASKKDLLDQAKGFLRPDDFIEVEVEFIIKSATMDHLV